MKDLIELNVDGKLTVISTVIADEFGRRHKDVIKSIESLVKNNTLGGRDFKPTSYRDKSNRQSKAYELTERGFLIAMPFIGGSKSEQGQVKLVDAFLKFRNKAEKRAALEWQQARLEGKDARKHETDTIKLFVDYAILQGSKSANRYYMAITKTTYQALFFVEQGTKWKGIRDILNSEQLSYLTTAEHIAAKALKDGMENKMYYKDIFQLAKERLTSLACVTGKTPAIEAA